MEAVDIFPFIEVSEEEVGEFAEELPMAREYAWDFERETFKYKNGKMYLVEGNEAIKIWLWKLFQVPRFRYLIHSWDYGSELESLIGKGYTHEFLNAEAKRYVEDAIEYNLGGYVASVDNVDVSFTDSTLSIKLKLTTLYGEVEYVE